MLARTIRSTLGLLCLMSATSVLASPDNGYAASSSSSAPSEGFSGATQSTPAPEEGFEGSTPSEKAPKNGYTGGTPSSSAPKSGYSGGTPSSAPASGYTGGTSGMRGPNDGYRGETKSTPKPPKYKYIETRRNTYIVVPSQPTYRHKIKASVHYPTYAQEEAIYPVPRYITRTYPKGKGLLWVDVFPGDHLPRYAVIGGSQPNAPYTLYICRGKYQDGMHPGKVVGKYCNISWGGEEIRLSRYQVLVSRIGLAWVSTNNGYLPVNAIKGGYENGHALYICQADYRGGMHSGKVVGSMCNIGYGGREIAIPYYNVLVR